MNCFWTNRRRGPARRVMAFISAMAVILTLTLTTPAAEAQGLQSSWHKMSQAQLSAAWWRWAYSQPLADSVFFDTTGEKAYSSQPYSDLLFLGGTFTVVQTQNGDLLGQAIRTITLKAGTALFFPLLNSEWDNVCYMPHLGGNCFGVDKYPAPLGVPAMQSLVAAAQDAATDLYTRLTATDARFNAISPAIPVVYARLQTSPFNYRLPPEPNLYTAFGYHVTGTVGPAVADGYYALVPGILTPGYYALEFGGTLPASPTAPKFQEAITYRLVVVP